MQTNKPTPRRTPLSSDVIARLVKSATEIEEQFNGFEPMTGTSTDDILALVAEHNLLREVVEYYAGHEDDGGTKAARALGKW